MCSSIERADRKIWIVCRVECDAYMSFVSLFSPSTIVLHRTIRRDLPETIPLRSYRLIVLRRPSDNLERLGAPRPVQLNRLTNERPSRPVASPHRSFLSVRQGSLWSALVNRGGVIYCAIVIRPASMLCWKLSFVRRSHFVGISPPFKDVLANISSGPECPTGYLCSFSFQHFSELTGYGQV